MCAAMAVRGLSRPATDVQRAGGSARRLGENAVTSRTLASQQPFSERADNSGMSVYNVDLDRRGPPTPGMASLPELPAPGTRPERSSAAGDVPSPILSVPAAPPESRHTEHAALLAIILAPAEPGETYEQAFRRKEHAVCAYCAALPVITHEEQQLAGDGGCGASSRRGPTEKSRDLETFENTQPFGGYADKRPHADQHHPFLGVVRSDTATAALPNASQRTAAGNLLRGHEMSELSMSRVFVRPTVGSGAPFLGRWDSIGGCGVSGLGCATQNRGRRELPGASRC